MKSNRIGRGVVGGIQVIADQETLISLKVNFTPLGKRELAKYLDCQPGILYSNAGLPGMRKLEVFVRENNLDVKVAHDMKLGRRKLTAQERKKESDHG